MKNQSVITIVIVFVALTLAGVGMIIAAPHLADPLAQQVFPQVGSAIFAAGLAFFLVEVFEVYRGMQK